MARYIARRLLLMIPVLLGVITIVFILLHTTSGDPARIILGDNAPQEAYDKLNEEMGFNDPLPVQYGRYLYNLIVKRDMGNSYSTGRSVIGEIKNRFKNTMQLAVMSAIVTLILSAPLGVIAAIRQYSWMDNFSTTMALIMSSMPNFFLGLLLSLLFALKLKWLPAAGWKHWQNYILPVLTVALHATAGSMRQTRSAMLEIIRQDYIRTARAKGQTELKVVWHHAFKNALIPIITIVAVQIGTLLGGAVVAETVFSIPGLGKYMVEAIKIRDYPVVQGGVLVLSIMFSLVNLAADILYAFIDPRIKAQFGSRARRLKREVKQ